MGKMPWRAVTDEGKFEEFALRTGRASEDFPSSLLCLDPGETVGWAYFRGAHLKYVGQLEVGPAVRWGPQVHEMFDRLKPAECVTELFTLYSWKARSQSWNDMFTSRVIGAVELICQSRGIQLRLQTAGVAKPFCTDDKLRMWGYYQTAFRHANDAIRHGCYHLLFKKEKGRGGKK